MGDFNYREINWEVMQTEVNELLGDDKFIENQRCTIPNKEEQVKQ